MVSLNQLTIVLGILAAQVVNWLIAQPVPDGATQAMIHDSWNGQFGWRWMFTAVTAPSLVFLAGALMVPESPRWLIAKGRKERGLATLTAIALKNQLFRDYVKTPTREYEVAGADGARRRVTWKNTNRLLSIDGYSAVKTGTTTAAGACLVSWGDRNGRELIVVVLGSTASDARYVDARNLFRWAWKQ